MKLNFLLGFLIFLFVSESITAQPWVLSFDKEGVKVYTRRLAHSRFKEFKGETIVNSSLSALVELLDDVSNQPNWLYNCTRAERLKTVSKTEGYNYVVVTAPWPVTDRDMIIHYVITQDLNTKSIKIDMSVVSDFIPEKQGLIRVPSMTGQWLFIPLSGGRVRVVYQVHSETGGAVPASIANSFVEDTPFYTLKNLTEEIKKPKYKNAVIEGVVEP